MLLEPLLPKLSLAIGSNGQVGLQKTKQANVNPFPSKAPRMRSWKRLPTPFRAALRRAGGSMKLARGVSPPYPPRLRPRAPIGSTNNARRSPPPAANRPPQIRYWRPRLKKAAFADHAGRFAEPSISGEARPSGARPANEIPRRARATNLRPGHGNVTFDL